MSGEGMDLYNRRDCRASCDTWCPRAEHEDMGRTFQVDLFRKNVRISYLSNTRFFP